MNCYRHPDTAAVTTCVACNQPICQECREEVAGHPMCHSCVAAAEARLSQEAPPLEAPALPTTGVDPSRPGADVSSAVDPPAGAAGPVPQFAPGAAVFVGVPPGPVRRILRGIGWGLLYGQWWTLWTILSRLLWQQSLGDNPIAFILFYGIVYAFFGSLTGLIIGASNASFPVAANVGVGVGVGVCLLEMALTHNFGGVVNLVFYYFTGRYVGAGIAGRVQHPVLLNGYAPITPTADRVAEAGEPPSSA